MKKVGLSTYAELPDLSPSDQLLLQALQAQGAAAEAVVWNDPSLSWDSFDVIIIRSCWDYHLQPDAFVSWIEALDRLGVTVWNPPFVLRWNVDKLYLRELEGLGVPSVPSVWFEAGDEVDLAALLEQEGWEEAVVKPRVSATAYETWRTAQTTAVAQQHRFAQQLSRSGTLVQKFLPQVADEGEWSLIFINGRFSHAMHKRAKGGDFRVQEEFGGQAIRQEPAPSLVAQAEAILSVAPDPLLYVRVDGVSVDGEFRLMELECIEPHLYFDAHPPAAEALAAAICTSELD